MKKLTSILTFMLIIAMVMPACKKYEEGPALSFRSKTARLVNQWKIEKVMEDGQDITAAYVSFQKDLVNEYKENGELAISYKDNTGATISYSATWEFSSDKTGVVITTAGVSVTSSILKLKNDELWLKTTIPTGLTSTVSEIHYVTN